MTADIGNDTSDDVETGLLDGREKGDAASRYSRSENVQLYAEGIALFLIIVLFLGFFASIVCEINKTAALARVGDKELSEVFDQASLIFGKSLFVSGVLGGSIFSLKWLYHSVANGIWNRDRVMWRFCVPLIGGILGVFVPFVSARFLGTSFEAEALPEIEFFIACGFSFLIGIFADGVLASLERLARRIFGTLEGSL